MFKKVRKMMNFSAKQNERKCINDDSNLFCKKNHFMKNIDETFLILITSDFLRWSDTTKNVLKYVATGYVPEKYRAACR